ncbi:MAG TPA: ATP-binding protein, partial [Planctomycetaceae bacterium]|nr:ATP-binding protein [Planctomycetaceae bacterium]
FESIRRPGGRGVLLIRNFMDEVIYNAQGNSLTMIKQMSVSE